MWLLSSGLIEDGTLDDDDDRDLDRDDDDDDDDEDDDDDLEDRRRFVAGLRLAARARESCGGECGELVVVVVMVMVW